MAGERDGEIGRTDGWMERLERWVDGWMDGETERRIVMDVWRDDGWMKRWTERSVGWVDDGGMTE